MIFYYVWDGTALARILGWSSWCLIQCPVTISWWSLLIQSDCLQLSHVTTCSLERFKYILAGSHRFNSAICCTTAWRDTLSYSHFCLTFLANILLVFSISISTFTQAGIETGNWIILYNDAPFFFCHIRFLHCSYISRWNHISFSVIFLLFR